MLLFSFVSTYFLLNVLFVAFVLLLRWWVYRNLERQIERAEQGELVMASGMGPEELARQGLGDALEALAEDANLDANQAASASEGAGPIRHTTEEPLQALDPKVAHHGSSGGKQLRRRGGDGKSIRKQLERLKDGFLKFACPEAMKAGHVATVSAAIALEEEQVDAIEQVAAAQTERVKVGELMRLQLRGSQFEIEDLNSDQQFTMSTEATQWSWNIKALRPGRQRLQLLVSVRLQSEKSGGGYRDFPLVHREVEVKVNTGYSIKRFWATNWQWLVGLVLGSGLLWQLLKMWLGAGD